jgi:DNA-binding MarR family transcriptional regulator
MELDMVIEQIGRVYGLGARDVRAIVNVAVHGSLSASQIASRLYVTRGAMTAMVRRLEAGGWVEVDADPVDRRRILVTPSARTSTLLREWAAGLVGVLDDEDPDIEHAEFCSVLATASNALASQRQTLSFMGPAELRALVERHSD